MVMKMSVLLVIYFFSILGSFSQQKESVEINLDDVEVVVILASGKTEIKNSIDDKLNATSFLWKTGKVIGVKWPKERPVIMFKFSKEADTIYLTTPQKFIPNVIGISTYAEHINNIIEIPAKKKVIVKRAEELQVKDYFYNGLLVKETVNLKIDHISKEEIASLKCYAATKLIVDGQAKSLNYEFEGTGNNNLELRADKIYLSFQK